MSRRFITRSLKTFPTITYYIVMTLVQATTLINPYMDGYGSSLPGPGRTPVHFVAQVSK
jgi:hypothetical protein